MGTVVLSCLVCGDTAEVIPCCVAVAGPLTHTRKQHQAVELQAQLSQARARITALEDRLTSPPPVQNKTQAKTPRTPQEVCDRGVMVEWGEVSSLTDVCIYVHVGGGGGERGAGGVDGGKGGAGDVQGAVAGEGRTGACFRVQGRWSGACVSSWVGR